MTYENLVRSPTDTLHRAVRFLKPSERDYPNVASNRLADELGQPAGVDDLDVVVEEEQQLAVGLARGVVVELGPVERLVALDQPVAARAQVFDALVVPAAAIVDESSS